MIFLVVIVLEIGIFIFPQVFSPSLFSVDRFKIFRSDPFVLPKECLDKPDGYNKSWSCLKSYFVRITNEVSVEAAMVEARKFQDGKMISDCHLDAHFTGEAALEKYNFDAGKAFSSCSSGCNQGCFHGVMEGYIGNIDLNKLIFEVKNVCDGIEVGLLQTHCAHGVDHGLRTHSYLPLTEAINACNVLDHGFNPLVPCANGLLMENMDQYLQLNLNEEGLKKILPKVCAPIKLVEPDLMDPCMYYLTGGLLYYTGYNIERTKELCEGLQQQDYINTCKNNIAEVIYNFNPSKVNTEKHFFGQ